MCVCVKPFNVLGRRFKRLKSGFDHEWCSSPRRKGPSIDDKGSCSFRHLQARGCVLLSAVPVVHVGGRAFMCALGVKGGVCI